MSSKNILITGITGQDGIFLTNKILKKDSSIKVAGFSRNKNNSNFYKKLKYLNYEIDLNRIDLLNIDQENYVELNSFISSFNPSYIYNLTGPSSVYESILEPSVTGKTMISNFMNLVNSLIENNNYCNFFHPSSSEMFNQSNGLPLDESSEFNPTSSYALSKLYIYNFIDILRKKYDWKFSNGILFNHESEFRSDDYLIMKIISKALEISKDPSKRLVVGSLELSRDWSYAEDIVDAMCLMVENNLNDNFVLGSGKGHTVKDIIIFVFNYLGIDWETSVDVDESLLRDGDPLKILANPKKIKKETGWEASTSLESFLEKCIIYKKELSIS
tara:strand:- start:56 stop:1045 length:990 start_codon:yes stop_codon:yes gene_type:complete